MVVWWSWSAAIVTILVNLWFLAITCSYIFDFGSIVFFKVVVSLSVLWGLTFLNIYGMGLSALLSSFSVIAGVIVPMFLVSCLASYWGFYHEVSSDILPNVSDFGHDLGSSMKILYFYGSMMLGYSGMEVAAFHAADARDPQRDYGKATIISACIICLLYVIGTTSLMVVVPYHELDPIAGFSQFFKVFFDAYALQHIAVGINVVLAIGVIGAVNTWLISPAKGIFAAMEHFEFPLWLVRKNQHGVPVPLLILQACICTIALIFLVLSHSQTTIFWILQAMSSQFSLLLYVMMSLAIMRLRYLFPEQHRPVKISSVWLIPLVTIALISCAIGMIGVFVPVEVLSLSELFNYELLFVLSFIGLSLPPLFFKRTKRSSSHSPIF
jgi:amino acid transporter